MSKKYCIFATNFELLSKYIILMIIRASFENVLSFNEETSISFVASKSDLLPTHVSRAKRRDDISILKTGLIYGANGSGKSNIIKCIESLCEQQIAFKDIYSDKVICLNTVNPKYFL